MFVPKAISIEGFGPYYTEQNIDFHPGLTFITAIRTDSKKSDSNGSGKTSLTYAIAWCLFGKCPDGIGLRDVISTGLYRCRVWLHLKGENQDLRITRSVTHRKHELEMEVACKYNPRNIVGDIRVVQEELERYIGCSFEIFASCLFLSKHSTAQQFLFANPTKRSELLSDLIDDHYFQQGAEIAKKRERQDLTAQELALRELSSMAAVLKQTQQDQQALLDLARVTDQQEKVRIEQAKQRLTAMAQDLVQRGQDLGKLHEFLQANQMQDLNRQRIEAVNKLEGWNKEQWRVASEIATIHDLEAGYCPTCGHTIDPEWAAGRQRQKAILQQELAAIEANISTSQTTLYRIDTSLQEVRVAQSRQEQDRRAIEDLRIQYRHLQDECEPRTYANSTDQIFQLQTRIMNMEHQIQLKHTQAAQYGARAKQYGIVSALFSKDVRNYLFDDVRGKLEQFTSLYLAEINDTPISVRYPVEAAREKFEITICDGPNERDISTFSTGENWRVAFALLLALRQVLWTENRCKLNFLIIDDPIGGALDRTGTYEFLGLMARIVTLGSVPVLLATVPKDEYCEGGNQVLRVTRTERGSTVQYVS